MNPPALLLALIAAASSATQASPTNTSCTPEAIAALEAAASKGDFRAQFWRGTQLEIGECGPKDLERANSLLRQSASQSFPPAVHVLGVILRREGKDTEAIKYFEQSAQLGYQAGFADIGFTYGQGDSPVRNAVLSYAWLTFAIAREANAPLRAYLESSRAKVARALPESDLAKAEYFAAGLREKFSSVPAWSDKQ